MKLRLALAGAAVIFLSSTALAGGVVKLSVTNKGKLKVLGDKQANSIVIEKLDNADIRVSAAPDRFGNDTQLKVGSQNPTLAEFAGVTAIDIKMKNGDDRVDIVRDLEEIVTLDGALKIDMGSDDDVLVLEEVEPDSLAIKTSKGSDRVTIRAVQVLGKTSINTGGDDDLLFIELLNSGSLDVKMDKGDDSLCIDAGSFIPGKIKVDGGKGTAWWDRIDDDLGIEDSNFEAEENGLCTI